MEDKGREGDKMTIHVFSCILCSMQTLKFVFLAQIQHMPTHTVHAATQTWQ